MSFTYAAHQHHHRILKPIWLIAAVAIYSASESQSGAALPVYRVIDLTSHFAPASAAIPSDINDLTQVVGQATTSGGGRGFFYSGGVVTLLDPLAQSVNDHSTATAVNSLGQIAGYSDELGIPKAAYWVSAAGAPVALDTGGGPDANVYATNINDDTTITGFFTSSGGGGVSNWTAVKWQPDSGHPDRFDFTKLNTPVVPPLGVPAGAFGINAIGEIVGSGAIDPTLPFEGALRWNATNVVTPLDTLNGQLTHYYEAVAINASSVAVGRYRTTTGVEHAVRWNADGSIVALGTPEGFTETNAFDINNDGIIVGHARAVANQVALIYADGDWVDLNLRILNGGGWQLETAVAINNQGAIVGTGTLDGAPRAFLLSPITLHPGDYNNDGAVDAADYVVWRKTGGSQSGHDAWRSNFGRSGGGGSVTAETATIPEPASFATLAAGALPVLLIPSFSRSKRGEMAISF
ncbi:MAG TPA: hypothetical protein VGK58_21460 [Lacipirellulaceae bacterium]